MDDVSTIVWLAIGLGALGGAIGGLLSEGGAVIPRFVTDEVNIGTEAAPKMVKVTLVVTGIIGAAFIGCVAGLLVLFLQVAPAAPWNQDVGTAVINYGHLGVILLGGIAGSAYINSKIEEANWKKLLPAVLEAEDQDTPATQTRAKKKAPTKVPAQSLMVARGSSIETLRVTAAARK